MSEQERNEKKEKIRNYQYSEVRIKRMYLSSLIFVGLLIGASIAYCIAWRINELIPIGIVNASIYLTGMVICALFVFSLAFDRPWDGHNRALFRLLITLVILFHFGIIVEFLEGNPQFIVATRIINSLLYFNETLLIYCFWSYVREEINPDKKATAIANNVCRAALFLDLILDIFNYFFGFYFYIDEGGNYVAGKWEALSQITLFIIYLMIISAIVMAKDRTVKEKALFFSFIAFALIGDVSGTVMDDYTLVYPLYLFSIILIYINVFSKRGNKLLEQQLELDQQKTALMVSQIQPHFIYNVLTTISNLCVTDPEEAEETTILFSQYLRTNLDALRQTDTVSFKEELKHIATYVELEKKRFRDKINVSLDCKEVDFMVPPLGLQPIVENSIKHGIRAKATPGTLFISSERVEGGVKVVIADDGVGFDMNAPREDDGRSHVGMANVKSRLEHICNATVEVESSPGNGCKTTIFFPDM